MWLDEMRTTGVPRAPGAAGNERRVCRPGPAFGLEPRGSHWTERKYSRIENNTIAGCCSRDSRHRHDRRAATVSATAGALVRRGPRHPSLPCPRSAALRETAHVALGAALDEGELRAHSPGHAPMKSCALPVPPARRPSLRVRACPLARERGRTRRAAQEVLLDALLFLHPLLDRDPNWRPVPRAPCSARARRPDRTRCPAGWRYTSRSGMPERSASEMSRPIASTSAMSAPPALPSEMKTRTVDPCHPPVMFTYMVPSGVSTRRVAPLSRSGRERLARRCRFSASASCSLSGCARARPRAPRSGPALPPGRPYPVPRPAPALSSPSRRWRAPASRARRRRYTVTTLAAQLVGVAVDLLDVLLGRIVRKVAGLGDRESVNSWNAACIWMCHSGVTSVRGDREHALPLRGT